MNVIGFYYRNRVYITDVVRTRARVASTHTTSIVSPVRANLKPSLVVTSGRIIFIQDSTNECPEWTTLQSVYLFFSEHRSLTLNWQFVCAVQNLFIHETVFTALFRLIYHALFSISIFCSIQFITQLFSILQEGYECQCCTGFAGSHCEEIDACSPSPCTNNGICVDLSQGHDGNSYQCLCPYGKCLHFADYIIRVYKLVYYIIKILYVSCVYV